MHLPPLFIPAPFFTVRIPMLPIQIWEKLSNNHEFEATLFKLFNNHSLIREALQIASPELYKALKEAYEHGHNASPCLQSFLRYALRMSSRPTPFGLFSFVGQGAWKEDTQGFFKTSTIQKRIRPDIQWLNQFIEKICLDPETLPKIPLYTNPCLIFSAKRILLHYFPSQSKKKEKGGVSIRSTPLTQAIFEFTKTPQRQEEIQKHLLSLFPKLDLKKTHGVIQQLIEEGILLLDVFPNVHHPSPLEDVLAKVSSYGISLPPLLKRYQELIVSYPTLQEEKAVSTLEQLYAVSQQLIATSPSLQVDTALPDSSFCLPSKIHKEIGEAAEFLYYLSPVLTGHPYDRLTSFHQQFIEKYGTSRRIPLLQLLDPHELGVPDSYQTPFSPTDETEKKWKTWLWSEWCRCIRERKIEIELDPSFSKSLLEVSRKPEDAPASFDLFCQLIASSEEAIQRGDYKLLLLGNTWEGGNTSGRFLDLLGISATQAIKDLYTEQEKQQPHLTYVEMAFLPSVGRAANVAIHPPLRSQCLHLNAPWESSLTLDEIYVGSLGDRFYLTDKTGEKEWIFSTCHVVSPDLYPLPLRFLKDVSQARYQPLHNLFWRSFPSSPFFPRIRYKNAIVSSAEWFIHQKDLKLEGKSSREAYRKALSAWFKLWEVPSQVLLAEGDNQLLLELQSDSHVQEIIDRLQQGLTVHLIEKFGFSEKQWVSSEKGYHFHELVVPFIKNPNYCKVSKPAFKKNILRDSSYIRKKTPGSEWLYAKIYMAEIHQEKFLLEQLFPFIQQSLLQSGVKEGFFIRYADPHFHFRLRFRGACEDLASTMIPTFYSWINPLLQTNIIQDFQFATYEREIERYGGEQLIEEVESFFSADTLYTHSLLSLYATKAVTFPLPILAAFSLINLLQGLGYSLEQSPTFLSQGLNKKELSGIRPWRSLLKTVVEHLKRDTLSLSTLEGVAIFHPAFTKGKKAIIHLQSKIEKYGVCNPEVTDIHRSLLHMHCNRLLGSDLQLEAKAYLYTDYALRLRIQ